LNASKVIDKPLLLKRFNILANKYQLALISDYGEYLDSLYATVTYAQAYNSIKHYTNNITYRNLLRKVVNRVYEV